MTVRGDKGRQHNREQKQWWSVRWIEQAQTKDKTGTVTRWQGWNEERRGADG